MFLYIIYNMSTYRQIVYMCMDQLQFVSDDSHFTEDHIIYLADKYRAYLIKKEYSNIKKQIPESNYQTICLDLERVPSIEGDVCAGSNLRSIQKIPETLSIGNPIIASQDFMNGEITYVSRERIKYVGHNKWLRNFIYATIGPDQRLYIKSANPQAEYLEKVSFTGIFEDSAEAAKLSCDGSDTGAKCDPLDAEFPIEDPFIPLLIDLVVNELSGAAYRPVDQINNDRDELGNKSLEAAARDRRRRASYLDE